MWRANLEDGGSVLIDDAEGPRRQGWQYPFRCDGLDLAAADLVAELAAAECRTIMVRQIEIGSIEAWFLPVGAIPRPARSAASAWA